MSVQATVRTWGPDGGTLVGDDGTALAFSPDAVDPAVRLLRPGQRVMLELDGERVVRLTVSGLPFT